MSAAWALDPITRYSWTFIQWTGIFRRIITPMSRITIIEKRTGGTTLSHLYVSPSRLSGARYGARVRMTLTAPRRPHKKVDLRWSNSPFVTELGRNDNVYWTLRMKYTAAVGAAAAANTDKSQSTRPDSLMSFRQIDSLGQAGSYTYVNYVT